MGIFRGIGRYVTTIYDVRADKWLNLGYMKNSLARSTRLLDEAIKPQSTEAQETFDEAMTQRGMTQADIDNQIQQFTKMIWIYVFITLSLFSYTLSKGLAEEWFGLIMGIGLTLFCGAHIFRYHYWRYLLIRRELGRTPKEWFNDTVGPHHE